MYCVTLRYWSRWILGWQLSGHLLSWQSVVGYAKWLELRSCFSEGQSPIYLRCENQGSDSIQVPWFWFCYFFLSRVNQESKTWSAAGQSQWVCKPMFLKASCGPHGDFSVGEYTSSNINGIEDVKKWGELRKKQHKGGRWESRKLGRAASLRCNFFT